MLGESQLLTIHHSRCYLSKRKLLPARKVGVHNWYHFLYAFQVLSKSRCDFQKCVTLLLDDFWIILYMISLTPPLLPYPFLSLKQSFLNSCFTHLGRTVFRKSLSLWRIQSSLFGLFCKVGVSWEGVLLCLCLSCIFSWRVLRVPDLGNGNNGGKSADSWWWVTSIWDTLASPGPFCSLHWPYNEPWEVACYRSFSCLLHPLAWEWIW